MIKCWEISCSHKMEPQFLHEAKSRTREFCLRLGNTSGATKTIIALPENARGKITAVDSITKALEGREACCFEGLFTRGEFHTDRVALI